MSASSFLTVTMSLKKIVHYIMIPLLTNHNGLKPTDKLLRRRVKACFLVPKKVLSSNKFVYKFLDPENFRRYHFGHSCQYRTICDMYCMIRIVLCVKSFVSYRRIVSVHESYDTVCISYESYCIVKSYVLYNTYKWFKMIFFC